MDEYIKLLRNHLFFVVGEEHYTPLGVIRSLGENNIKPIAFIKRSKTTKIASVSKYILKLYRINNYEEALQILLTRYGDCKPKPFVIPCDDIAVRTFEKNYQEISDKFYVNNAGKNKRIAFYQQKRELYALANECGLNTAETWLVERGEIPQNIKFPIITKPNSSYEGWKQDYFVCNNRIELEEAYKKIKGKEILLQQYIEKKTELCIEGVSVNKGKSVFFAIATKYTYTLPDYYSMEMIIDNFKDEKLKEILLKMFSVIGFEGIFEIEFMVDKKDNLWFLEINYRNSTWSYAATKLGMNLPVIWAYGELTGDIPKDVRKEVPDGYRAIAEVQDFEQRVRRFKMISFSDWIKRIVSADCLYIYTPKDMKPVIFVWFYKFLSITRKTVNRLLGR